MRRFLAFLLILALTTVGSGCISGGGGGDSGGGSAPATSDVTLSFDVGNMLAANNATQDIMLTKIIDFITMAKTCYAAQLYEFITSLHIEVTGDGMSPITHDETITEPSSTFSVTLTVPNGSDRRFYVELKDRNDNILYSGDLTIDVGDYQGTPQDISIDVTLDEGIGVDDYIEIGRGHLENPNLELAFIAFDTAVSLDNDHPVANFFRGFVRFLLLVQKDDDPTVDVDNTPNADIASMLNFYADLDDVYSDTILYNDPDDPNQDFSYNLPPDIYDEDEVGADVLGLDDEAYDDKVKFFLDNNWSEWENSAEVPTDDAVDVLTDVILPELDNIISDLANAEADPVFSTTLTTDMHFGIESTIKVDRADVFVLEAIAYGLKAYLSHILAYNLRTDAKWWKDNMDPDNSIYDSDNPTYIGQSYEGLQDVIDREEPYDNGRKVFDFANDSEISEDCFSAAKSAYLAGLDKLKAALQSINARSAEDKIAEDHIFNVVDVDDDVLKEHPSLNKVDISKIDDNLTQAKDALGKAQDITFYDDYEDSENEDYDIARLNLSKLLSSDTDIAPDRDSRPEFYYHSDSDEELPIFDTNKLKSSSAFMDKFKSVVKSVNGHSIDDDDDTSALEDALSEELLYSPYKFDVYKVNLGDITIDGQLSDYNSKGIRPVMFDEEDDEKPEELDLTKVYMAQDGEYLYMALKVRGKPLTGPFATEPTEDHLNYNIRFNARDSDCSWNSAPVSIELHGSGDSWEWYLRSYGSDTIPISTSVLDSDDYKMGDVVEFRLPLDDIADWIQAAYQLVEPGGTWEWNEEEIFVAVSLWSNLGSEEEGDWIDECLANLNMNIGE